MCTVARGRRVSRLLSEARLFFEILGRDVLEERFKLFHFLVGVEVGLGQVRERRPFEHVFFGEERCALSYRQRERVRRPGVELDEAASLREVESCVERPFPDVVDDDMVDASVEVGDRVEEEVMGHGARGVGVLYRQAYLGRLVRPDPYGNDALFSLGRVLDRLENEDGRLGRSGYDEREYAKGNHACSNLRRSHCNGFAMPQAVFGFASRKKKARRCIVWLAHAMVEHKGIEPLTSGLQSPRSPS